jgi:uncharacterized delta-60 repeat protein
MGTCNAGGAGIFRLFADGSPDTTFDSDGKAFYLFSNFSAFSEVYGHMLQNGKMILVTATWDGSFIDHFTAIAYDSTGSRDTLFGVNGFFTDTTSLDIYSNGLATALQQDEKIIIVANRPSLAGIEAVRINSDGTIDTTFGNGGHVSISTSQYLAKKVRVLLNGQILILGKSDLQDGFGIMLLPDGTIDSTFGTNGFMVLNMGQNGPAVDLLEMSSGDMLIAGTAFSAFRVVRYTDHSNVPHITDNGIQLSSTGTGTFQWFMNGNALAGEVNSTYSYTQNGTYTVQLTDQAGCTYLSDSVVITNTGIQGALNENYSVYPNPADQFIKLKNLKNSFKIIDPEGRIIFSRQNIEQIAPETIEINTSSIENGIYFLRNLGGSMTKTQRIIIHH